MIGAVTFTVMFGVIVTLVVYGIARMFGKARTPVGAASVAFYTMLVLLLPTLGSVSTRGRSERQQPSRTAVTAAEREGLQIAPDSIRHPILGFTLPHPGVSFMVDPELQAQVIEGMAQHPDIFAWTFNDTVRTQALVLQLTKMRQINEMGFQQFTNGIRKNVPSSAFLSDSLHWSDFGGDYELAFKVDDAYTKLRCRGRSQGGVIVCATTASDVPDALEFVRAGLNIMQPQRQP